MFLQRFGFKDSPYERPRQDWVCGRSQEGRGCNTGPTPEGRCGATYECFPQRTGDRWHCTRDALGGGRCGDGPQPDGACSRPLDRCLPVAALRRCRRRGVLWGSLFIAGVLLLGLTGSLHEELISAGPLSFSHRAEASTCKNCHSAAGQGLGGWLTAALTVASTPDQESRLCMECHQMGEAPLHAHSLPPQALAAVTQRAQSVLGGLPDDGWVGAAASRLPAAVHAQETLACVRCHREHRGPRGALTEVSDEQCQVCHLGHFDSLDDGHPPFVDYPFDRRTRIAFDHASHHGKHYPEEEQDFTCVQCHSPDPAGETMLVTNFEAACGECHAGEIQGQGATGDIGVAVLAVPGLDLGFVVQQKLAIGEWPEDAEGDIPPLMAVLLSADPAYREIAPLLQELDLLDLESGDDDSAGEAVGATIETLAWSIKRLLYELSRGGQKVLQARLETALGERLELAQLASLSGMLAVDV
ncbi:MAG: hypothetical protein GY807_13140, partial [Gammaproteobacteria bacterium]|nr:hypothetical protein [Gammaproteobacteria bacterium]